MSNSSPPCERHKIQEYPKSRLGTFILVALVGGSLYTILRNGGDEVSSIEQPASSYRRVVNAFIDKKATFQGLPIIQIGNPEEIDTLKTLGKDGWYIFHDNDTVKYWRIERGIIESGTYTVTQ